MDKIDKIGFFDKKTGESLDYEVIENIQRENLSKNIKRILNFVNNRKLESLSLYDLELLMKINKRNQDNILIDLGSKNERYFMIKDNFYIAEKLDNNTLAMLYKVSQLITHDNTIVTRNNIALSDFKDLCEYLNIPYSTWKNKISKHNKDFNIIKKEKINNRFYLVLNPLFAIKSRNITEYSFKCFYRELKEYLHPIDYLYLVKLYGIDPNLIYKHETEKICEKSIDVIEEIEDL